MESASSRLHTDVLLLTVGMMDQTWRSQWLRDGLFQYRFRRRARQCAVQRPYHHPRGSFLAQVPQFER
jgi:hypothetical protein